MPQQKEDVLMRLEERFHSNSAIASVSYRTSKIGNIKRKTYLMKTKQPEFFLNVILGKRMASEKRNKRLISKVKTLACETTGEKSEKQICIYFLKDPFLHNFLVIWT